MTNISRLKRRAVDVPWVAVFVGSLGTNLHAGIVFKANDNSLHLLEQAWHHKIRSAPAGAFLSNYGLTAYCIPDLLDDRAEAVCGLCRKISNQIVNGKLSVPYSLKLAENSEFSLESGLLKLGAGHGLTCVTFVSLVFKSAKVPIVRMGNWPIRKADEKVHLRLLERLKADATPEHVKRVSKEVRCARVRPEEIAGACLQKRPASPADAIRASVEVANCLGWPVEQ